MIRNARIADITEILALARRLQPKTPYADVPIDAPTLISTAGNCINNAFGFAMVSVHEDRLKGVLLGAATPLWFSRKRMATDFITHSEHAGDGYKMIGAFIRWAWSMPNVVEITMGQSSGIDIERTGKLYERAGLVRVGSIFTAVREVSAAEEAA